MNENANKKILAHIAVEDFIGRTRELETIRRHVNGENDARGMIISAAPSAGISEFLRQIFDAFFNEQKIIPFYFAFSRNDQNAKDCAVRFLQTFLLQTVAFRRNDTNLLNVSPDVCEINELAAPSDAHWIHQLTKICVKDSELNNTQSFIRQALSAPLRAAANDAKTAILLDDLQNAPKELIEELKKICAHSTVPFVFAGRRRFILKALLGGEHKLSDVEILKFDDLQNNDAEILAEKLAKKLDVKLNEASRDLIVRQSNFKPVFIEAVLTAAREQEKDLDSFQTVEKIYTDELFGGQISKFYDDIFSGIPETSDTKKNLIGLLREGIDSETKKISAENWFESLSLNEKEFDCLLKHLHIEELINFNFGTIYFSSENLILKDYIESNDKLENGNELRARVVSDALKNSLKRASQLMGNSYRAASALGLRELLGVFNCQSVPARLIDYAEFKNHHKETGNNSDVADSEIKLPQIIYAASGASFYPPIAQATDENRVAVALGFEAADYRQENETAWLAAEIDSKLEAEKELTEFWCDRLEAIAIICNFTKYRLWLVAPEGFSPEAVEVLKERDAFGSSRRQVELLIEHLKAEKIVRGKNQVDEYEMILPMSADTELIAANAVEEVAKKHNFPAKDITKIKTALVEAYINATEHSHSPDRKIYQKFSVDEDKITITIANRGVKLSADKFAESVIPIEPDEGRRGWGLKLMRTLMDEVNFEQVDDGTRISMVKYLRES